MGVFGMAYVNFGFVNETPALFKLNKIDTYPVELETALEKYGDGAFDIHDYEYDDSYVELKFMSGRTQHMNWQVQTLLEFLKERFPDDLLEFSSSGYEECDSGSAYWEKGDD
jgi:hypothetical protein